MAELVSGFQAYKGKTTPVQSTKEKSNRYVIYRHVRPDKQEVFYIGRGKGNRPYDLNKGRNNYWKSIYNLNNKNIEIDILEENLTWEESIKKEIWWIAFYGRKDLGLGTLCNLTDGGDGAEGFLHREESKKKMSDKRKGELNPRFGKKAPEKLKILLKNRTGSNHPNYGKVRSEESKKKQSITSTGRKRSIEFCEKNRNRMLGNKLPEDVKRKISESLKGKTWKSVNGKSVINTATGIIYPSIQKASNDYKYSVSELRKRLQGVKFNDTPFQYYKEI